MRSDYIKPCVFRLLTKFLLSLFFFFFFSLFIQLSFPAIIIQHKRSLISLFSPLIFLNCWTFLPSTTGPLFALLQTNNQKHKKESKKRKPHVHTHAQTPTLQTQNPWLSHFLTVRSPRLEHAISTKTSGHSLFFQKQTQRISPLQIF